MSLIRQPKSVRFNASTRAKQMKDNGWQRGDEMSEPEWNQKRGLAPHAERETQKASVLENNEGRRLSGGREAKVAL